MDRNNYHSGHGVCLAGECGPLYPGFPGYVGNNLSAIGAVGSANAYFTFGQYNGTTEIGVTTGTGVLHIDSNTSGGSARSRGLSVFIDTSAAVAGTYTVSFDVLNWVTGTGTAGFKVVEGSGLDTLYIELDNSDNNNVGDTPNFNGTATAAEIGTTGAAGTGILGNGTVSFDVELTEAGVAGDYLALAWVQVRSTSAALAPKFDIDNVNVVAIIPEPATLGMIASVGVGIVFIRRRLMM